MCIRDRGKAYSEIQNSKHETLNKFKTLITKTQEAKSSDFEFRT